MDAAKPHKLTGRKDGRSGDQTQNCIVSMLYYALCNSIQHANYTRKRIRKNLFGMESRPVVNKEKLLSTNMDE